MVSMGLQFGLESNSLEPNSKKQFAKTCLRKFRWLLKIDDISASGINSLPPSQSSRPNLSFTEMEVRHLNENFYYPGKPDWKPIQLVLYDVVKQNASGARRHPVFEWIKEVYDPKKDAKWKPASNGFIKRADLEMYDGCGNIVERWVFENAWPQSVDFGSLDMNNSEILTCDIVLRYARAYIESETESETASNFSNRI